MNNERREMGLLGWLNSKRVSLPLKGVECEFDVKGGLAEVRLQQLFFHDGEEAMDCTYSFPLPAEAAVFSCEMHINDRVVRAEVREEGAARALAASKAGEGMRTLLVEMERDNLFTLSLSNVQPDDLVVVRLSYFQTTEGQGRERSLRIPFTPGVRYIPGVPSALVNSGAGSVDDTDEVPDASRITPPRIDALHADAAYVRLQGVLDPGELESGLESPSHGILVERAGGETLQVKPKNPREFPDRDFVLRWTLAKPKQPALRGWRKGDYALVELTAPESMCGVEDFAQDVYFLLDQSGSMSGMKWRKAANALIEFFRILGPNDRAFATVFESRFKDVTAEPKSPAELLADRRVLALPMQSGRGGTNLLPALNHVLAKIAEHSVRAERHASIVLITDGQVGNERSVLQTASCHPDLRVHTFGIDSAVNDGFLKSLAGQQRGTCRLQAPQDDITGGVVALGRNMRQPVLLDVGLSDGWNLPGGAITDLFGGQVLPVALRGEEGQALTVSARLPDGERWEQQVAFVDVESRALSLLWSRDRIAQLMTEGRKAEAIALACTNNLLCEGASFVAIDEAESGAVATSQVYQPSMEPRMAKVVSDCVLDMEDTRWQRFSGPVGGAMPLACELADGFLDDEAEIAIFRRDSGGLRSFDAIPCEQGSHRPRRDWEGVMVGIQFLIDAHIDRGGRHIVIELERDGRVAGDLNGLPVPLGRFPSVLARPRQVDLLIKVLRASALLHPKVVFTLKTGGGEERVIAYPDGPVGRLRELAGEVIPADALRTGEVTRTCDGLEIGVRLAIQQLPESAGQEVESYAGGWFTADGGIHVDALEGELPMDLEGYRCVLSVSCQQAILLGTDRRELTGPDEIEEVVCELVAELMSEGSPIPE